MFKWLNVAEGQRHVPDLCTSIQYKYFKVPVPEDTAETWTGTETTTCTLTMTTLLRRRRPEHGDGRRGAVPRHVQEMLLSVSEGWGGAHRGQRPPRQRRRDTSQDQAAHPGRLMEQSKTRGWAGTP